MRKLGIGSATNPKRDERVWVPDAIEGYVLGVVIRVSFEVDHLLDICFLFKICNFLFVIFMDVKL